MIDNLQVTIQEHDAQVTHDSLPRVWVEAGLFAQLLQNLIGNALKFIKDKVPQIHLSVKEQPESWLFSIKDNGIGIAPEHLERIFGIFQRLHTRKEYAGTGIGLAVCKRIVEYHNGQIWVESKLGEGTTFYFTIPKGGAE